MILRRYSETEDGVHGRILIGGVPTFCTLENKETLIPTGTYKVEVNWSNKFKRMLPLIYNEENPASRGLRIHRGNYPCDSSGCILVGLYREKNHITMSVPAEQAMVMLCREDPELIIESII